MVYGIAALIFLGALVAFFDKSQVNAVRALVGLGALHESETRDLSVKQTEAEMAELAAMPLPGLIDGSITLGEAAAAVRACAAQAVQREAAGASGEAVERFLINLVAAGFDDNPVLIEPSLRELRMVIGRGPLALLDDARNHRLSVQEIALLDRYHETYSDPDHPLYRGLQLYGGTFDGLEFESMTKVLPSHWDSIGACSESKILPPLAEWQRLVVESGGN